MLRAYPPTWLMGRIVARPTTLDGWHLRAGDQVMFSPYLIHRDSRWWVDPDRIDPDRWLGAEPPHPPRGYFPFGAGPRTCLGTHLGTLQLVLATSWMVHAYRIEVDAGPGPLRSPRALLIPDGLRARFIPRPRPRDGGWPAGHDPSAGAGLTATA
jgi:unspecific monooxygenase